MVLGALSGLLFGQKKTTRETFSSLINQVVAESMMKIQQDCNSTVLSEQLGLVECKPNDGYSATTWQERTTNESNLTCFNSMKNKAENMSQDIANHAARGELPTATEASAQIVQFYRSNLPICKACVFSDIDMSLVNNFSKECSINAEFVSKVQNEVTSVIEQLTKSDKDVLAGIVDLIPSGKQDSTSVKNWVTNNVSNKINIDLLQSLRLVAESDQEVNIVGGTGVVRGITQNQQITVLMEALTKQQTFQDIVNDAELKSMQKNILRQDTTGDIADAASAIAKAASRVFSGPLGIIFIVIGVLALAGIIGLLVLIMRKKKANDKKVESGELVKKPPIPQQYIPIMPPKGVFIPDGQKRVVLEADTKLGPTGAIVDARTGYPVRKRPRRLTTKQIIIIIGIAVVVSVVALIISAVVSTSSGSGSLNSSNSSKSGSLDVSNSLKSS